MQVYSSRDANVQHRPRPHFADDVHNILRRINGDALKCLDHVAGLQSRLLGRTSRRHGPNDGMPIVVAKCHAQIRRARNNIAIGIRTTQVSTAAKSKRQIGLRRFATRLSKTFVDRRFLSDRSQIENPPTLATNQQP